jgi:beta-glucosidase
VRWAITLCIMLQAEENADAVLWLGFNGQFSGLGLFDVLSGRTNPGARMPYTVPRDVSQLPTITNYNYDPAAAAAENYMGRTYRYINLTSQAPLYPFGFGRSYSTWQYSELHAAPRVDVCEVAKVNVTVSNTDPHLSGSEVVQLYVTNEQPRYPGQPRWALAGFERVDVAAGASTVLSFTVPPLARAEVRAGDFARVVLPTSITVYIGGGQPHQIAAHTTTNTLSVGMTVTGSATALEMC